MFRPQPSPYAAPFAAYGPRDDFAAGEFPANSTFQQQASLALFGVGVGIGSLSGACRGATVVQAVHVAGAVTGAAPGIDNAAADPDFDPMSVPRGSVYHYNPHQHQHQHNSHQHQHQRQHLHLHPPLQAASAPAAFHTHTHTHSQLPTQTQTQTNHSKSSPQPIKMEAGPHDDLAAQEAAAREYQPQLQGPLVGDKTTSHAITDEYAKADQIYVEKTIALPQTYSHFRPIQGDGNCGWRAIGFCFFETLILTATKAKVDAERQRIASLNQYLANVGGYEPFVWEDMVEETDSIFEEISNNLTDPDAALRCLEAKFNDSDVSNAVIYHLRLLAASYLKGHPIPYEPFIPNPGGIQAYCSGTIEPSDREIDHLGITLLVEVLLKPAGFVLEIAYLDRSPGSQVNIYRFPDEANGQDEANLGPIIHLLFRPDHYDILYKPLPQPVDVQVNRVDSFSHIHQMAATGLDSYGPIDYGVLAMLPGFGAAPPDALSPFSMPTPQSLLGGSYTPSPEPAPSWGVASYSETVPLRHASVSSASPASSGTTTSQQQQQVPPLTPSSPIITTAATSTAATTHPLRFSKYSFPSKTAEGVTDLKPVEDQHAAFTASAAAAEQQTMTTATFKNSHFNVAHYNNPNFQPEEYRPGEDDMPETGTPTATRRRRKDRNARPQHQQYQDCDYYN